MSNFHSDISLYCIVNAPKVKPLWDSKAVSGGKFENIAVDKLADRLNISIDHNPSFSPRIQHNTLQLPPKSFYATSTSYYHSILHELGHKLSNSLWQTKNFVGDAYKYVAITGERPNFTELSRTFLTEGIDYFKQDKFANLLKNNDYTKEELQSTVTNLVLLYSKEETKVEIAAMKMLGHAGFRLDKHNTDFSRYVCGSMERVNNLFGKSLIEQSKSDQNFKMEYDNLLEVYKHRYNEVKKEYQKSKSRDGMER
jgi:hypothetical protein